MWENEYAEYVCKGAFNVGEVSVNTTIAGVYQNGSPLQNGLTPALDFGVVSGTKTNTREHGLNRLKNIFFFWCSWGPHQDVW